MHELRGAEEIGVPLVNLNGTGREALRGEALAAYHAVHAAIDAVAAMTVHGRDHQVAADPQASFARCRDQHRERLGSLERIRHELEHIVLTVTRP